MLRAMPQRASLILLEIPPRVPEELFLIPHLEWETRPRALLEAGNLLRIHWV